MSKSRDEMIHEAGTALTKKLLDDGRLLEAGWHIFRGTMLPAGLAPQSLDRIRLAYLAGAEHVFSSMLSGMDEGDAETDAEIKRMENLSIEIAKAREELNAAAPRSQGRPS